MIWIAINTKNKISIECKGKIQIYQLLMEMNEVFIRTTSNIQNPDRESI